MRHLTIAFAAVAMTALFAAPVSAERIQGGPIKQNGQCWKSHSVPALTRPGGPGGHARRRPPRLRPPRPRASGPDFVVR